MRILYLLKQFPTLSETFILEEIAALFDLGHEVAIFAFKSSVNTPVHGKIKKYRLWERLYYLGRQDGGTKARSLTQAKNKIRALSKVIEIIKKHKIEHIHCHFGDFNTEIAWIVHRALGVPYTFTTHGYDIFFKPHPNLAKWASLSKKVITVSDYNRKYMIDRLRLAQNKVQVIPCGIDLSAFKSFSVKRNKRFTILTVGRLVSVKGFVFLLKALKLLADQGIDFQCWIIGKGEQEKSLKDQISKKRLEKYVTMLGAKRNEELPCFYNKADVFVLPSVSEGSPTVLKESLACAIPVIATNVRGVSEIVTDHKNGFLIAPKRPLKIAEKIKELMNNQNLLTLMKKNARKGVGKKFDVKKTAKILEKIFLSKK